jgi:hypothetical protein
MGYLEGRLATGEELLRREHQHWFVLLANARYALFAWIIAVLLLVLNGVALQGQAGISSAVGWLVVILVIGGLLSFGWEVLRWRNEEFAVTTRRVLQSQGVVNKEIIDSSLEKINDAILKESIFGRIFGFGDLEILTASESGISRLEMLRQADDFKRTMLDAKHELELELSGARPMPGPALRAPAPPPPPDSIARAEASSGSGAAAAAAPASSPASPAMSADDVTRTLASLADLRDRGAISAEEYEAKKADLLRRL